MSKNWVLVVTIFEHISGCTLFHLVALVVCVVGRHYIRTNVVFDVLSVYVGLQPWLHVVLVLELTHAHLRGYLIFTGGIYIYACQVFVFDSMSAFGHCVSGYLDFSECSLP